MKRLRLHRFFSIFLAYVAFLDCRGAALLNRGGKWEDSFTNFLGKRSSSHVSLTNEEQKELVLRKLNLTSSVEPKPFSVEPIAIPAILGASVPVRQILKTSKIV